MKINRLLSRVFVSGLMIFNSLNLLTMYNNYNNNYNNHYNNNYRYDEASTVVWTSWDNNRTKWVLLARESGGRDAGTWDCFGGGRNQGESNPLITATRELYEETAHALLDYNRLSAKLSNRHDTHVIRDTINGTKTVTYIVNFNNKTLTNFTHNFYKALRSKGLPRVCKEKDSLAWVKYDDLRWAINNHGNSSYNVYVTGNIINRHDTSRRGQIKGQRLKLRPFFVKKMHRKL